MDKKINIKSTIFNGQSDLIKKLRIREIAAIDAFL